MKSQDNVLDLLILLGIMNPMKITMEALQGTAVAPWKVSKYVPALIAYLEKVDTSDLNTLPLLQKHIEDVRDMRFQGM